MTGPLQGSSLVNRHVEVAARASAAIRGTQSGFAKIVCQHVDYQVDQFDRFLLVDKSWLRYFIGHSVHKVSLHISAATTVGRGGQTVSTCTSSGLRDTVAGTQN